tara:strand:+ start:8523 stop:9113 length:591 start_codon:yes stop_codon:yes gene_type:complete
MGNVNGFGQYKLSGGGGSGTTDNIYTIDGTVTADRTVTLPNSTGALTFTGSGTSKITFSNAGGVQIDEDTTFKKNAIIEGQGYTEIDSTTIGTIANGGTATPDFNNSNVQSFTIADGGAITLANPTNIKAGATYILIIKQGGANAGTISTLGSAYKFSGGTAPTLTVGATKCDVFTLVALDTSNLFSVSTPDFTIT